MMASIVSIVVISRARLNTWQTYMRAVAGNDGRWGAMMDTTRLHELARLYHDAWAAYQEIRPEVVADLPEVGAEDPDALTAAVATLLSRVASMVFGGGDDGR